MVKLNIKKEVEVEAKTIRLTAKCSDCCCVDILDQDRKIVKEHDGYVPGGLGIGGGDYVEMEIDIDTGKILKWQVTEKDVQDFVNGDDN